MPFIASYVFFSCSPLIDFSPPPPPPLPLQPIHSFWMTTDVALGINGLKIPYIDPRRWMNSAVTFACFKWSYWASCYLGQLHSFKTVALLKDFSQTVPHGTCAWVSTRFEPLQLRVFAVLITLSVFPGKWLEIRYLIIFTSDTASFIVLFFDCTHWRYFYFLKWKATGIKKEMGRGFWKTFASSIQWRKFRTRFLRN